jgi:RNA polymerase sigma-70 factor (ECF subfamily)
MGATGERGERSDDQVLRASVAEPDHFMEIFDRHGSAVHAYLARRAGSARADDLLSEVWLQAFRSRDRFEPGCLDARPWLYGISRNVLRAHWRNLAKSRVVEPLTVVDEWDGIDARLDAEGTLAEVRAALDSLDPDDREVLLLVAWESLGPTQVATVLGVAPGTVRWRLHRARSVLRRRLSSAAVAANMQNVTREASGE